MDSGEMTMPVPAAAVFRYRTAHGLLYIGTRTAGELWQTWPEIVGGEVVWHCTQADAVRAAREAVSHSE